MKLSVGHQQFTVKPENDVDRTLLLLLEQECAEISFNWAEWESQDIDSSRHIMPVFIIEFKTRNEHLEENT